VVLFQICACRSQKGVFHPLLLPFLLAFYTYLISCPIGVALIPKGKGARPRPSRTCSASAGGSHLEGEGEGGKEGGRVEKGLARCAFAVRSRLLCAPSLHVSPFYIFSILTSPHKVRLNSHQ